MSLQIRWFGHSCFQLITSAGTKIVMDPYDPSVGSLPADLTADVVLMSHQHFDHNYVKAVKGKFIAVDAPGPRRIADVNITGIPSWHDDQMGTKRGFNIIFLMETDGIRLCHLGDLGTVPSKDELLGLTDIDYLLTPVGGTYTIDPAAADKLITTIMPRVVIPMHYGMKPGIAKLLPLSAFIDGKSEVQYADASPYKLGKPGKNQACQYLVLKPEGA